MTSYRLAPWSQKVHLQADVEAGSTAVATYAIDLGALVRGDQTVPLVYRKPERFLAATYLTSGLYRLLSDVLNGLAGGEGDRVLQLRSPFGGGKSHTLATLYHGVRRPDLLTELPDGMRQLNPGPVRVAVFDGEKFGTLGDTVNGREVRTVWGALAASLDYYTDEFEHYDSRRVAPGGGEVGAMLGDQPTLILMDEVLKYLERAGAEVIGDSTLGRQTQEFLQTLSTEVANTRHAVLVYSLQASTREAFGDGALLSMLDHLTSRVDAKREPVSGDEVLPVLRRRLLAREPDPDAAEAAAEAYADEITNMQMALSLSENERRTVANENVALRSRFLAAYPFHPALIDIMRERWASLPDFQRTRGSLRFLAVCLHALKRNNRAGVLLGPGDIPMDDPDVAQAFFTEVGQREPFQAVLQRDFFGPNARVNRIDERLSRERPDLSGTFPARRIATSVLAYSFGGLLTADASGGDPTGSGVNERELLDAVVGPELDSITAQGVLKELREQCLYLHYDGARYVFRTTPNVTQAIEDQATTVRPNEIDTAIEEDLRNRLSGRTGYVLWPKQSQHIPNQEPRFQLAYLPLDFAAASQADQQRRMLDLLTNYGDQPRRYRNGVGLVVPDRVQVEALRRAVRYLTAVELVRGKRLQLNLTQAQMEQLKERERTEKTQRDVAMRDLYQAVWLPILERGKIDLQQVSIGGWPLMATTIHERFLELLTGGSPKRVYAVVTPQKIAELMRLGADGDQRAVSVSQIIDSFFSVLDFPRMDSQVSILRAITKGVSEGIFGCVGPQSADELNRLRESGGYLVSPDLVRINTELREDEIDITTSFILLPQAISAPMAAVPPATGVDAGPGNGKAEPPLVGGTSGTGGTTSGTGIGVSGSGSSTVGTSQRTQVRLSMRLTRQQLYSSFNAFGNLAEKAGVIQVTVEAQKADGFDAGWLRNAVLEPLEEADIAIELDV